MRIAFAVPLILVCGLASAAMAQASAQSADNHAQTVSTAASQDPTAARSEPKAQAENPEAAAALAMAIRQREAQERRIAQYACAAGDTSKCPAGDAPRSAGSPSS
jgi:hypothetical protein